MHVDIFINGAHDQKYLETTTVGRGLGIVVSWSPFLDFSKQDWPACLEKWLEGLGQESPMEKRA